MKWRNQDWFWLTAILISFIIFISAFRLSDNVTFMNVFSFMASGVSIALAFVAMYTSFKQNSENQMLTTQMNETLARMDEKINSMGEKVSRFDVEEIKGVISATISKSSEVIEESIKSEGQELKKEDVIEIINQELSKTSDYITNIFKQQNRSDKNDIIKYANGFSYINLKNFPDKNQILSMIKKHFKEVDFSLTDIEKQWGRDVPRDFLKQIINELVKDGVIERQEHITKNGIIYNKYRLFKTTD